MSIIMHECTGCLRLHRFAGTCVGANQHGEPYKYHSPMPTQPILFLSVREVVEDLEDNGSFTAAAVIKRKYIHES